MDIKVLNQINEILKWKEVFDNNLEINNGVKKCAVVSAEARAQGNKIYQQKTHNLEEHQRILHLYGKSVAYAPENSRELALAYGNRSAVWMHLNEHKKCLIDCNRALRGSISNALREKLLVRKIKCYSFIIGSNDKSKESIEAICKSLKNFNNLLDIQNFLVHLENILIGDLDELAYLDVPQIVPSQKIPTFAESIMLKYSKKYGRHIVAGRDIEAGQVIAIEEAYTAVPKGDKMYTVCSHCLEYAWNGIPCNFCPYVIYCSQKCKQEAWEKYHNVECSLLPFLYCKDIVYEAESLNVVATVRLLITAIKQDGLDSVLNQAATIDEEKGMHLKGFFSSEGKVVSNKFQTCYNLQSHDIIKDDFFSMMIFTLLSRYTDFFLKIEKHVDQRMALKVVAFKKLLCKLKSIVDCNAYSFQDFNCNCVDYDYCAEVCTKNRGVVLMPCCSLLNHSCYPNINRTFVAQKKMMLFASRPIKKGEQLFITYGVGLVLEKELRQQVLQEHYQFVCDCQACHEDWPTIPLVIEEDKALLISRLINDFTEKYCSGQEDPIFTQAIDKWVYNPETLGRVLHRVSLIYKYYKDYSAALLSTHFRQYIMNAYNELYGINAFRLNDC